MTYVKPVTFASELAPKAPKVAVDERGYVYPLTTCHDATGKGLMCDQTFEGYVGCRQCFVEVSDLYGTGWNWDDETPHGWPIYVWLLADWHGFAPEVAEHIAAELKDKVIIEIASREGIA